MVDAKVLVLICLSLASFDAVAGPPPVRLTERSLSLGNASDGHLVAGRTLGDRGPGYRVMAATRRRGYTWGTTELTDAIKRAALEVAGQYPKSTLIVANLSRESGGDIGPSVSHNSGRDADIAFYAIDERGRAVASDQLVLFDAEGNNAALGLRFDPARNWALVKAFLTDPSIQVQWLFCKGALREKLLLFARRAGEPEALIARASDVLGEPGNSSSHSEHFHIRIYCGLHERLLGCRNYGTLHAWVDDFADDVAARTAELVSSFSSKDDRVVLKAIALIGAIEGHTAGPALVTLIGSERALALRFAALETLVKLDGLSALIPSLNAVLSGGAQGELRVRLVDALSTIADPSSAATFLSLIGRRGEAPGIRARLARGLGLMRHGPAVPALVAALIERREVAQSAQEALLRITGRSFGAGKSAITKWQRWWSANQEAPRTDWLKAAFSERGVKFDPKRTKRALSKLVALMRKGGALSECAREVIRDVTGYSLKQEHYTDRQMYRFYRSWLLAGPR
ncbi:MAG: penicillin-insensitive murein endopeptidase [Myxococcales bacterium]|nr:penicillin-insensitive murein endopeptidase [Myxococcales bacterium]